MKVWPILYAKSSTGSVIVWWMEQDGDRYRSTSGQQHGAKVISEWTTAKPKNVGRANATTAIEQATLEIKSKYDKQLKSGGYWENVKDIDNQRFFQVMLAKDYPDFKSKIDWSKGVGVQIKYNGGRILANRSGLWTRKGERYASIPHIEEALQPFFKKFPDAVLDGEGFNYELREKLNEIMKLLRKTVHITSDDLKRSKELIRFYIYDGYGFPTGKDEEATTQDSGYLLRKQAIDNAFFASCFADRYKDVVHKVPTWFVKSEQELEQLYKKFLDDKQEGAILRILDVPYEQKRSKYLLKYKPEDDSEYEIVSFQEGDGKFAGRVSTVTCRRIDGKFFTDNTNTFDASFKGTEADAIKLWNDKALMKSLIGKKATIYYHGFTGKGKPNYAKFDWNNWDKGN